MADLYIDQLYDENNALRAQLAQAKKELEEARAALRKFTHRPPCWGINSALDAETAERWRGDEAK